MTLPATDQRRMPAEWERHTATWIGWPHRERDWPGRMGPIPWVFAEFVRWITPGEPVHIVIRSARARQSAEALLARGDIDMARVRWFELPVLRSWVRDSGPIFVRTGDRQHPLAAADFKFTAWARYRNWRRDDRLARAVASTLGIPVVSPRHQGRRVVLEGGAVDVNGRGTLLATEECLLDQQTQVRNPGFTREDYGHVFHAVLGVTRTIWLGRGIAGDEDTHGHVDDVCRFVNRTTVLLCQESNRKDANYRPMQENRERLESARLENGARVQVVALPMPAPVVFEKQRLPASYANFYISNHAVLVPTFNDPKDRTALGIIAECFPGRKVVGIHAGDLIWGLGTIHCLTQQQPEA